MELSEATKWGIVVALVAIPFCYYYWRRWDRPSKQAREEQERRLKERETREVFQREEVKLREHERQQALVELQYRKTKSAMAPSSEVMSSAFTNIDSSASIPIVSNTSSSVVQRSEEEISLLESIPETMEVPDIEGDESVTEIIEDEGPVSLKVGIEIPEEVKKEVKPVAIEEDFEWPEWE